MTLDDPDSVIDKHLKRLDQNTYLFSYKVPKHLRQNNLALPLSIRRKIRTSDYEKALLIAQVMMLEVELLISMHLQRMGHLAQQ